MRIEYSLFYSLKFVTSIEVTCMNHAPGHSIPEQTADPVVPQPTDGDIACVQRPPDLNSGEQKTY